MRLLGARAYRTKKNDILEVNARKLIREYRSKITLSPINSGSTIFNPSPRGKQTFSRIPDYAYAERPRGNRAAELAVDYSIPNIATYVTRIFQMQGDQQI